MTPIRMLTALAVLSTAVVLAACGGGGGSTATAGATPSSSKPSGASPAVTIVNFSFQPATLTVKRGTRVTVTNRDSTAHTATADDGHSFDTGNVDPGASKTIVVKRPGSYAYICTIHPNMHGTLIVQ